jgi:hypothetical protein
LARFARAPPAGDDGQRRPKSIFERANSAFRKGPSAKYRFCLKLFLQTNEGHGSCDHDPETAHDVVKQQKRR